MYIVQEIQTHKDGTTALGPAIRKENENEALSEVYRILQYAAISNVKVHTVVAYDEHGNQLKDTPRFFEHLEDE